MRPKCFDDRQVEKSQLYQQLTMRNEFIRKLFGRYLTDEIAETILSDPDALKPGGKKDEITILLSDLRGFTPNVGSRHA